MRLSSFQAVSTIPNNVSCKLWKVPHYANWQRVQGLFPRPVKSTLHASIHSLAGFKTRHGMVWLWLYSHTQAKITDKTRYCVPLWWMCSTFPSCQLSNEHLQQTMWPWRERTRCRSLTHGNSPKTPIFSIDATFLPDWSPLIAATFSFLVREKTKTVHLLLCKWRQCSLTKAPIHQAPDLLRRLASLSSHPRSLWNNSK